jgi:hypothetical protein
MIAEYELKEILDYCKLSDGKCHYDHRSTFTKIQQLAEQALAKLEDERSDG